MKNLIIFILLNFFALNAHGSTFFTAKELRSFSINKKTEIYLNYVQFFVNQEKESLFKHVDTIDSTVFLEQIQKILFSSAYAKINGEFCFFGGWKSTLKKDEYCIHPRRSKDTGYKNDCQPYEFKCNPALFGKTCVIPFERYANLTATCFKKFNSNNLLKPFLENKKWSDFEQIQKDVDNFCNANQIKEGKSSEFTYDACESLKKQLEQIKNGLGSKDTKKKQPAAAQDIVKENVNSGVIAGNSMKGTQKDPDRAVVKAIKIIEETTTITEEIIQTKTKYCPENKCHPMDNCSQSLLDRSKSTYDKGWRGALLFQDSPQEKCEKKFNSNTLDLAMLDSFLKGEEIFKKPYASFYSSAKRCLEKLDDSLNKKQAKLAKTFMMVDFYEKQARLAQGSQELLQGMAEINALLGDKLIDDDNTCGSSIADVDKQCQNLKKCNNSDSSLLDEKANKSKEVLAELKDLTIKSEKLRKLMLIKRYRRTHAQRRLSEFNLKGKAQVKALKKNVDARIAELKRGYPWLSHKKFMNASPKSVTKSAITASMIQYYAQQKKKLKGLYKDNIRAYQCLYDEESVNYSKDCDDIDLVIKRNPHLPLNELNFQNKNMAGAMDYYQCAEDQRHLNHQQVDKYTDYAIMAGLSVVPFGLGHLGRVAVWGGRALLAADTAYLSDSIKKQVGACEEGNKALQSVDSKASVSCNDFSKSSQSQKLVAQQEKCLQQGLTSASVALLPYAGFAASRALRASKVIRGVAKTHKLPVKKTYTGTVIPKAKNTSLSRYQRRNRGRIIDVEVVPKSKMIAARNKKALPAPAKQKLLPAPTKQKLLPAPKKQIALNLTAKHADSELTTILKKFKIKRSVLTSGKLSAKDRERILLSVFKKEGISISKGGSRQNKISVELNKVIANYKALAKANPSKKLYYNKWIKTLKGLKKKPTPTQIQKLVQQSVQKAENDFSKILKKLKIDHRVYSMKNIGPRKRAELINYLYKKEKFKTSLRARGSARTKAKLRRLKDLYSKKIQGSRTEHTKAFYESWLIKLKGI